MYKGHEQSLQRVVALKVLPARLARDAVFVKRFLREARAVARLNHPNIVTIHAVGQQDGAYCIAMEYVKGRSLTEMIRKEGQIDVRKALDILAQSAEALAEAHKHGIIHRDIKPHNIMVDEAGRVKVMDFGLARAAQSSTELTAFPLWHQQREAIAHRADGRRAEKHEVQGSLESGGRANVDAASCRVPADDTHQLAHKNARVPLGNICVALERWVGNPSFGSRPHGLFFAAHNAGKDGGL